MIPAYEHVKQIIESLLPWQERLGLGHYIIKHEWSEGVDPEDVNTLADTDSQWQYLQGTITWYLPALATQSDEGVERTYVHEHIHIALEPMEGFVKGHDKECELAVQTVARALVAGWGSLL